VSDLDAAFSEVREARPSVPDKPCLMCEHDQCQCRTDQVAFDSAVESIESEVARQKGRIATADRYLKKAEDEKTHGLTANAEYIDAMVTAARIVLLAAEGRP